MILIEAKSITSTPHGYLYTFSGTQTHFYLSTSRPQKYILHVGTQIHYEKENYNRVQRITLHYN